MSAEARIVKKLLKKGFSEDEALSAARKMIREGRTSTGDILAESRIPRTRSAEDERSFKALAEDTPTRRMTSSSEPEPTSGIPVASPLVRTIQEKEARGGVGKGKVVAGLAGTAGGAEVARRHFFDEEGEPRRYTVETEEGTLEFGSQAELDRWKRENVGATPESPSLKKVAEKREENIKKAASDPSALSKWLGKLKSERPKLPAPVRTDWDAKIKAVEDKFQEAEGKAELLELAGTIGNALINIGRAQYGLRHGVDLSTGAKFDPVRFESVHRKNMKLLDAQLDQIKQARGEEARAAEKTEARKARLGEKIGDILLQEELANRRLKKAGLKEKKKVGEKVLKDFDKRIDNLNKAMLKLSREEGASGKDIDKLKVAVEDHIQQAGFSPEAIEKFRSKEGPLWGFLLTVKQDRPTEEREAALKTLRNSLMAQRELVRRGNAE